MVVQREGAVVELCVVILGLPIQIKKQLDGKTTQRTNMKNLKRVLIADQQITMKKRLFTRKNNLLVRTSIYLIKRVWHGKFGRDFNRKNKILCRFYPSCSNYSIMAIRKYGFIWGGYLSYKRIRRCNNHNTDSCIDYP